MSRKKQKTQEQSSHDALMAALGHFTSDLYQKQPKTPASAANAFCYFPPLESDNLGCHPSQRKEMEKDAEKRGVPTHFVPTDDGYEVRPRFETRKHRKRYLRAYNLVDRSGGYSD